MHRKKNILFVSHDASRTGAPIILLNFLKWLRNINSYDITILLKYEGNLYPDFQAIAPTYILNTSPGNTYPLRLKIKLLRLLFGKKPNVKIDIDKKLKKQKFDLIYLNTVLSIDLAQMLKENFNCPILAHIHENEFSTKFLDIKGTLPADFKLIDHFIAVSNSTKNNLLSSYQIAPEKVSRVYAFIPIDEQISITKTKAEILQGLNLTRNFIVGGSGVCGWRKGTDLFIQLAFELEKLRPSNSIKLVWVGDYSREFECQYQYELTKMNVADKIMFTGAQAIPKNYFQIFDVFALTSREDPFPLVALEAASMGKPVIFFDSAGGMPELFVEEKGGLKVAFADINKMADAVLFLYDHPEQIKYKSNEAVKLVQQNDINIVGKQIIEVINQVIEKTCHTQSAS